MYIRCILNNTLYRSVLGSALSQISHPVFGHIDIALSEMA